MDAVDGRRRQRPGRYDARAPRQGREDRGRQSREANGAELRRKRPARRRGRAPEDIRREVTFTPSSACAFILLLAAIPGCSWGDPRETLVRLGVPYTTDAWLGQAGAGDTEAVTSFLEAGMDPNAR